MSKLTPKNLDPTLLKNRQSGRQPPKNAVRVNAKSAWATACLWAHDEISRLLASEQPDEKTALTLARRYRLVSPISGAVVLETDAQYVSTGVVGGTLPPAPPAAPPPVWEEPLAFSSSVGSGLATERGQVGFDLRSMWAQSGSDEEALLLIPVAFLLIPKLLLGPMIRIPFEVARR